MTPKQARQFKDELESRLEPTLEWYRDCIVCQETLDNVRRDVNSLFDELCKRYQLNPPFLLRVRFDNDFIVVDYIDRKLN